jgi:UTP:GlnB (protein PII) uridylyltransferase
VAWLVRYHLLMSATAFKRDLSDFKTILDFCDVVQSPERLRLLLVLTVVDIRAVGRGVWNGWKRQLLTDLYDAAEEVLRLGHKQRGREQRIAASRTTLQAQLGWDAQDVRRGSCGACPRLLDRRAGRRAGARTAFIAARASAPAYRRACLSDAIAARPW